jgi:hypothetical protein
MHGKTEESKLEKYKSSIFPATREKYNLRRGSNPDGALLLPGGRSEGGEIVMNIPPSFQHPCKQSRSYDGY